MLTPAAPDVTKAAQSVWPGASSFDAEALGFSQSRDLRQRSRKFRLAGLHPLLGQASSRRSRDFPEVSCASPCSDHSPVCGSLPEASGALCVLRVHRKCEGACFLPTHDASDLAQMVASAIEQGAQDVAVVWPAPRAVPIASGSCRPLGLSCRSAIMIRGAGCNNPACPDLWEAGESNLPGPPDILSRPGFDRVHGRLPTTSYAQ